MARIHSTISIIVTVVLFLVVRNHNQPFDFAATFTLRDPLLGPFGRRTGLTDSALLYSALLVSHKVEEIGLFKAIKAQSTTPLSILD